jgi:CheY-like chemotaxis protein
VAVRDQDGLPLVRAGIGAVAFGIAACMLLPLAVDSKLDWFASAQLVGFMLAAVAIAGVLGFLFGVPRTRASASGPANSGRFEPNSNLEQISDWFTKVLVGAGLVQLLAVPGMLGTLGNYLAKPLSFSHGGPVAIAVVLYGAGVGFIAVYLWARLRLRVLVERSEVLANAEWPRAEIESVLRLAEKGTETPKTAEDIAETLDDVEVITRRATKFLPVLWVDDNPGNNAAVTRSLQSLGIRVQTALSTDDALARLGRGRFGLIITDFGRNEAGRYVEDAGLILIGLLVEGWADHPPILVYTGSRGMQNEPRLLEAGAVAVVASPTELFALAVSQLASQ